MKSATLFLVIAIGIDFVAAADLQSSAIAIANAARHYPPTGSLVNRQQDTCTFDQLQEIFKDYPTECDQTASGLDPDALERLDPAEIARFGAIFCKPECGNPVVVYFRQCSGSVGENLAQFFIQFCAQNSDGDRCYSRSVVSDLNVLFTTCDANASACCQSLESTTAKIGCCINLLNVGGLVDTTDIVGSDCSVNIPGNCRGSTISGAVIPTFGTLLGALAVLVAIMLQGLF